MRKLTVLFAILGILLVLTFYSCKESENTDPENKSYPGIDAFLTIDIDNLLNYSDQNLPAYYQNLPTNTPAGNPTTNIGATLGRVLFYDKALSINNSISCASCHMQSNGFTDSALLSLGFEGGKTGAHSMRLANAQYYLGLSFFWNKRASSLETQTTMPIQDPIEMGFDAAHGGIASLIKKLSTIAYYQELFDLTYGSKTITENKMQDAMAQFIRSMNSVNSKFDEGFADRFNPNAPGPGQGIGAPFANYTTQENEGKILFLQPTINGGAGCAACHNPPSFSLAPNSLSNGLTAGETVVFKSPSLKNVSFTGPYMHDGSLKTLDEVIEHYNSGILDGPSLDNRLKPGGIVQALNLSADQKAALVAFLNTLADNSIIADQRFSNPFK